MVDAGGYTCFAAGGRFLRLTGMVGLAYTPPEAMPGVDLPPAGEAVAAVLLMPEEAEAVRAIGTYRVLALLGRAARYYPHPPWSDPRRRPVLSAADLAQSFLGGMGGAQWPWASVRMVQRPTEPTGEDRVTELTGTRVALRLPRARAEAVRQLLAAAPADGGFSLALGPDPEADVRLTWRPGDEGTQTIAAGSSDASCLTGGFLAFVPGDALRDGVRIVEDGFAAALTPGSWARVRAALTAGQEVEVPAAEPGGLGLAVEWVDGPGPAPAAPPDGPFRVEYVMLYQPDEDLRIRVPGVASLAEYVKRVEEAAADWWAGVPAGPGRNVLIVAAVRPGGRARGWVDVTLPEGLEDAARECAEVLTGVRPPAVHGGPVAVAVHADLWGGGEGGRQFIPREWQEAAGRQLAVPDEVLPLVRPD